jgi:RNA polymerase sigma factor (sigma-70 family)
LEWELRHARELVWLYLTKFSVLRQESKEDLVHECLTHWYFQRDQYDVSKQAAIKTFMSRVIENKLMDIIDQKLRQKRKISQMTIPLESLAIDDDDELAEFLMVEDKNFEEALKSDVSEVINRALAKLSSRQKEMCRLVKDEGMSMKQVSKVLNIPRATLFDETLRIREIFRSEGLNDYL